jgi:hypothetical protein
VEYESVRTELAAMRRDLRWIAPIWVGLTVALTVWRALEGDPPARVAAAFVAALGLGVALVPVLWLRYRGSPRGGDKVRVGVKVMSLALAWLGVTMAVTYVLASLLESS